MLIVMKMGCTEAEVQHVVDTVVELGFKPLAVPGESRTAICVTGNKTAVDEALFLRLPGVKEVIRVTKPFKLVSREVKSEDTVVNLGSVKIGGNHSNVVVAGPCSVETEARTLDVAQAIAKLGIKLFRAGAFKPRTSPYDFQGLGLDGLKILKRVRDETGLAVVTEVIDTESVEVVAEHVDVLQVGTRNMQNYSLLKKLARIGKPIILKRGMSASLEEWLNAAEYLLMGGNPNVILCERGIRTFSQHTRNTLDLNVVPLVRKLSHLPIMVDPSHGIGRKDCVRAMSRAAIACGTQGLLIEAHITPESAFSDQAQTVDMSTLAGIMSDLSCLAKLEPII